MQAEGYSNLITVRLHWKEDRENGCKHTHQQHRRGETLAPCFADHSEALNVVDVVLECDLGITRGGFNLARGLIRCTRRTTLVSWIVGPSAMGSENGTPSSMTSAPPSCIASITGTVSSTRGYPAVTKVTSAGLVCNHDEYRVFERNRPTRTELFFAANTF